MDIYFHSRISYGGCYMTRIKYATGFILSLILTFLAYYAVVNQFAFGLQLLVVISSLAIVQAIVQLVFFLHLDSETKPRYKLASFFVMVVMLLILVVGTLWIMYHLNYNMMQLSPDEKNKVMLEENGGGF